VGARVVYDAHELYPDMLQEFGIQGSWPVQAHWKNLERRLVPRADAVVTVSDGLAAELTRRFGVKPVVVRNVPPTVPIGDPLRLRSELGLSDDPRPLFLYQGVLIPGRGLVRLVEAVALVPGVVLAVQGFGPEEEEMRSRARELSVEDRVRFMGRRAPVELHDYASGADAGVVIYERTTLNNYLAGPNKLYAYMMAGLPVASSDFPGLAEVVDGERVGVTFDPADASSIAAALSVLASDPDARSGMGARARHLAETRYNWDIEKLELLRLYEELATRSTS
jgi:glycosyltransferase involved in cell wall biosynthesis